MLSVTRRYYNAKGYYLQQNSSLAQSERQRVVFGGANRTTGPAIEYTPPRVLIAKLSAILDNKVMLKRLVGYFGALVVLAVSVALSSSYVSAEEPQSPNYKFSESTLGAGGLIQSSSANFQGRETVGDVAVGNANSSNYQINAGGTTTHDPSLSFSVGSGSINFGNFSATNPTVTTSTFTVLNYTSHGYVVQMFGTPPTNGSTTIDPMTTAGPSTVGVSQFGINLVANTSPVSVGSNLNNGQFGFGQVAPNYSTPNQYRYVSGDTIALAPKSSGLTTYTITYLVNVPALTPGGKYTSDQTLIVTGTY